MSQKHVDLYNTILGKQISNLNIFINTDYCILEDNDPYENMFRISQDLLDF
jgi:hypothetical protein